MTSSRKSRNYTNGKIYMLTNSINDMVYIGSTCEERLCKRMVQHKIAMNDNKNMNRKIYVAMKDIGNEHFAIELIESYPCRSKDELYARESYWIRYYNTIKQGYNNQIAKKDEISIEQQKQYIKQYTNENKERIMKRRKLYCDRNKEKIISQIKHYYLENKEKIQIQRKKYLYENKEKIRETRKKYERNNKDKYKCDICKVSCYLKTDYNKHIQTKNHAKNSEAIIDQCINRGTLEIIEQPKQNKLFNNKCPFCVNGYYKNDELICDKCNPNDYLIK
jgi:hypothetical protein